MAKYLLIVALPVLAIQLRSDDLDVEQVALYSDLIANDPGSIKIEETPEPVVIQPTLTVKNEVTKSPANTDVYEMASMA